MRVAFFGSGEFGVPTLARLAAEHEVAAVITQPDRPAGRSQKPTPTPIAAWASHHLLDTPMLKPGDVNDPRVAEEVRSFPADVFVVIAFGQKLGASLLADRFAVNLHASLLPRWRGAAPINHAILAGDAETGDSVITLADRMDAGLILAQSRRAILPETTAGELHDLLSADGPELVLRVLDEHRRGRLAPVVQDPARITLAPKLRKEDGWIDFGAGAEACRRRIHGLNPWPGVTVRFRDEPLKILRAESRPSEAEQGGMPLGAFISPETGLVCCTSSALRLVEVQPAGGRAMAWADFARGRRVRADEVLIGGKPC